MGRQHRTQQLNARAAVGKEIATLLMCLFAAGDEVLNIAITDVLCFLCVCVRVPPIQASHHQEWTDPLQKTALSTA